jgi:hypothetical protein
MRHKIFTCFVLLTFSSLVSSSQVTSFSIDDTKLNKSISDSLGAIYKSDQSTRLAYIQAKQQNKPTAFVDSLMKIMKETDDKNLKKVNAIVREYGWLGPQNVGIDGAQGLFLVIQHADLKTQEYYLPIIRQAEKEGKILSSNLAILEDRICMRNGRKQIYGSQGFTDQETGKKYIYPIGNIDGLEDRRKAMGLPPMKDYIKEWDLEQYKIDLPNIEQIVKKQNIK